MKHNAVHLTLPREGFFRRNAIITIVCGTHFLNHFQSTMLGVLYPILMKDLGIGLIAIGALSAAFGTTSNLAQVSYGFIVPYFRRGLVLGIGNCVLGLSVLATGFASTYGQLFSARIVGGLGSSAQHPVGSGILASHFVHARGRALALHSTAANLGGLLGPVLVAVVVTQVGWRGVFWVTGAATALIGLLCCTLRDGSAAGASSQAQQRSPSLAWDTYRKCLKNKNVLLISSVLMMGAAGQGQGINETYLIPHFVNDLRVDLTYAAFLFTLIQVGAFVGPMIWGWLSDRFNRTAVIQISLLMAGLATLWLGWQQSAALPMFINLIVYGAVTASRQNLTQALLSDIVEEDTLDAAFSIYYFIGFVSVPFWTLLTGVLMTKFGFGPAFSVISISYVIGMGIMLFVRVPAKSAIFHN